jgi:hypothetical protein
MLELQEKKNNSKRQLQGQKSLNPNQKQLQMRKSQQRMNSKTTALHQKPLLPLRIQTPT